MSHTPGPWIVKNSEVFSEDGEGICVPYSITRKDRANARLIASAPELYEAAKYVAQWNTPGVEELRKALTKADGKKWV